VITTYQKGNRRRTYRITDKGLRLLHLRDHLGGLFLTATSPSSSSPKTIIMR
jgi:predicted transcriptional regulator